MRSSKSLVAGLSVAILLSTGAFAGSDLNEVGALLVYPTIVAADFLAPHVLESPLAWAAMSLFRHEQQ